MSQLRNVVVFEVGESDAGSSPRRALAADLRWIREIGTLGFVTFLPSAPLPICGVVNAHGSIMPVIDLAALLELPSAGLPRQGDPALIVEVEHIVAAFRIDAVRHVATLPQVASSEERTGDRVVDRDGAELPLIDLPALVRRCAQLVGTAARSAAPQGSL